MKPELVGKKFGRWTVVKFSHYDARGKPKFECLCDCGRTGFPLQQSLLNGDSVSCGCFRLERISEECATSDSALQSLLCRYKNQARERGLSWELSEEQFRILTQSPCYYTGRAPSQVWISSNSRNRMEVRGLPPTTGGTYVYNGVDRLDSSKGYTAENCVPCCKDANLAKQSLSHDDFIQLCIDIVKHKVQ